MEDRWSSILLNFFSRVFGQLLFVSKGAVPNMTSRGCSSYRIEAEVALCNEFFPKMERSLEPRTLTGRPNGFPFGAKGPWDERTALR